MLQSFQQGELLMKSKWIGLTAVAVIAFAIIAYKQKNVPQAEQKAKAETPAVVLVIDPSEENEKGGCGDIIHAVREARQRGIAVSEFPPNSQSDLLKRYKILTAPTVVILDRSGNVTDRFEGEDRKTIEAIQAKLTKLNPEDRP